MVDVLDDERFAGVPGCRLESFPKTDANDGNVASSGELVDAGILISSKSAVGEDLFMDICCWSKTGAILRRRVSRGGRPWRFWGKETQAPDTCAVIMSVLFVFIHALMQAVSCSVDETETLMEKYEHRESRESKATLERVKDQPIVSQEGCSPLGVSEALKAQRVVMFVIGGWVSSRQGDAAMVLMVYIIMILLLRSREACRFHGSINEAPLPAGSWAGMEDWI